MKKVLMRTIPMLLSIAILIASVPFTGLISVGAASKTFTETFDDISKWEDIKANYYNTNAAKTSEPSTSTTVTVNDVTSTALLPARADKNRRAYAAVVKDEYWNFGSNLTHFKPHFSYKIKIPFIEWKVKPNSIKKGTAFTVPFCF